MIALTSPFAFTGADVSTATPPVAGAATQTLVYDPLDRVTDTVLPTGEHRRTAYHPLGATVTVDGLAAVQTTLDGQEACDAHRADGQRHRRVGRRDYDAAGKICNSACRAGRCSTTLSMTRSGASPVRTTRTSGPRTMHYDDGGRMVSTQNGAGDVVSYGYDEAGRLVTIDRTDITTRLHYDTARTNGFDHTAGQLAWVEEPSGTVDIGYDALGRPQSIFQRTLLDGATTITGREATQFSPSGLPRSWDLRRWRGAAAPLRRGRTADADRKCVDGGSYNPASMPMREQFANGVVQSYDRDLLNRPTRVTVNNAGGSALYNVAATYNTIGAIDTLTDSDGVGLDHNATFGFDGRGGSPQRPSEAYPMRTASHTHTMAFRTWCNGRRAGRRS